MPGVKRGRQSFTFEYKLKVIARADNFVSSQTSFVFGCGLSASAGNLLEIFSCYCKKRPMRVIYRVGNRPEITVHVITMGLPPGGGTLGISGWGCAAGTLEPLAYTRASSAEFCYPILE